MMDEERAARYSDLFASGHDHSGENCAYCPICATIGVLRNTRPEVLEHLAKAAKELVTVASILVEEASEVIDAAEAAAGRDAAAKGAADGHDGDDKVRRIDIS